MAAPKLELAFQNEFGSAGWLGRVFIVVWRKDSPRMGKWFADELAAGASRFKSNIAHLCVAERTMPSPPPEARNTIAEALRTHRDAMTGVAVVFEGQGFFASIVRSVATNIAMLMGNSTPVKTMSTLVEAAQFLGMHMRAAEHQLSAEQLEEAVSTLRARFAGTEPAPRGNR